MKSAYHEYHTPGKSEVKKIWSSSLIVLDTNVLLDFYCFAQSTLDDYYKVLEVIKDSGQLWMPYQVGFEFYENRVGIISKQLKQYDNIIGYLDHAKGSIQNLKNNSTGHSTLDFESIAKTFERVTNPLRHEVESLKNKHPDYLDNDAIVKKLQKIYSDDLIGSAFTSDEVEKITKEGELRFEKNIPPGYKDQKKDEGPDGRYVERKYGDLVIWKEMIARSTNTKKSIIFVTNDAKEDWIQYASGKRKIGPKPALKKELFKAAGTEFLLYSSDEFLEYAHNHFNIKVDDKSVEEVKKYRERENERVNALSSHPGSPFHADFRYSPVVSRIKRQIYLTEKFLERVDLSELPVRIPETISEITYRYTKALNYMRDGYGYPIGQVFDQIYRIDVLYRRLENITEGIDETLCSEVKILKRRHTMLISRLAYLANTGPAMDRDDTL